MSKMIEVFVPDIGDFDDVEVIELLVSEGDTINVEDSLITVESDKATMEIPSSHAGVVAKVKVAVGERVAEGSLVILLDAEGVVTEAAPVEEKSEPAPEPVVEKAVPEKKLAPVSAKTFTDD